MKYRPFTWVTIQRLHELTTQSSDQTWQIKPPYRHITKQANTQGGLACHRRRKIGKNVKSIHRTKTKKKNKNKTQTKYHSKTIQNAYFTHPVCLIYPYVTCNLCIWIHWVTHTAWKLTETYSGCHITQPIQHITWCCQEPWPI